MTARPEELVLQARDKFLAEHGLRAKEYGSPRFDVRIGPFTFHLANPKARREAVAFHDLHHVATGFPAEWKGEVQVSAWEVGAGLGGLWVAWVICVPFFLAGLLTQPRRTWRTYCTGRTCRSLFARRAPLTEVLALRVGELRDRVGIPRDGLHE